VSRLRAWRLVVGIPLLAAAVLAVLVAWLNRRDESPVDLAPGVATAEQVARGAYLARAGNCAACHTDRGGAPYAGGKGIETPFGTVFASNLTPDPATGIGRWSPAEFWRALHNGRSADGRLLYPAFPYPSFTEITRADSDALHAFLRTQVPVARPNRAHALRFPYDTQAALAVWRALFFRPAAFVPDPARDAAWNRGAYLVRALGHCAACHSPRNAFGATRRSLELSGGLVPMQGWYAPSLASSAEAGVADWPAEQVHALLRTGVAPRGATLGPMSEVVFRSTQYLSDADLAAMTRFLQGLPAGSAAPAGPAPTATPQRTQGAALYADHCAACHGANGEGGGNAAGLAYVALAGNRKVQLESPTNLLRIVLSGGYPPTTAGNPRPYGMPPFGQVLKDAEVAAIATYVRGAWGNRASEVSEVDVLAAH